MQNRQLPRVRPADVARMWPSRRAGAPPRSPRRPVPVRSGGGRVPAERMESALLRAPSDPLTLAAPWTGLHASARSTGLYVEIPVAGGQVQDLAVSANDLTVSELISIVASGLSVVGSSDNP